MDSYVNEEASLKKQFDIKLVKRILHYAKPFWLLLIVCILMLLLATVSDLIRPYLIKIAIDDYISAYDLPMVVMKDKPEEMPYTEYNKEYYIRVKNLKGYDLTGYKKAQLIKKEGSYYLINDYIENGTEYSVVKSDNKVYIQTEHNKYLANKISKDTYLKFRENDKRGIKKVIIIFFLILLLSCVFAYVQVYVLNYVGQKVIYSIRKELFGHIQKLSLSFFDENPVGRLVTRVTNDMNNINEMFTSVLVSFLKDIFLIGGTIVIMMRMNLKLSLVSFCTIPIVIFASFLFRKKARKAHREVKVKIAKINSTLNENITGMKIIQIFNKEKHMFNEFDKINTEHKNASMKELFVFAIFRPTMDFIYSLTLAILIWYGVGKILGGALQFGVLFAFVNYVDQMFRPIFDLSEKFNILQSAMASSERVFQLMDTTDNIKNIENTKPIGEIKGDIEFKNVWFAYDEDYVLKDVSFKINSGETAAFVGATGSGKTTIISLLTRLYDIQKGEILIDGKNVKEMDKYELRSKIGAVLQDVFIFSGTIKDNIRLGQESITDDKIRNVSEFVNADKFINTLPDKYNEEITERGTTFSAGQRQLLSFARALAFQPSILILDEATSNIDTETEMLIQDAISKVVKDRTTIVVAHRLSTIQKADKIIVMSKGRIKEMGNHQELLNQKGMYYDLYSLQYSTNY